MKNSTANENVLKNKIKSKGLKTAVIAAVMLSVLLMASCGASSEGETRVKTISGDSGKTGTDAKTETYSDSNSTPDAYSFVYNNVTVTPNDYVKPLETALGEEYDYRESASCAYVGLDKCYIFKNFVIYTYPDSKSEDHVLQLVITTDAVPTVEGLRLGDNAEKVKELYGNDYTDVSGSFKYVKGNTSLQILMDNGIVSSIQYWYIDPADK